jgi:ubiquinone/menaquinone biosynthesis C-methylase UbiE
MTDRPPHSREVLAYDQSHARHDVDVEADAPWHRMIKSRLRPTDDLAGKRVLEIGCGRGGFAAWLARHPAAPRQVVAADFSPTAVAKAAAFGASQGLANVEWTVADIQKLDPFADGEFDTVFSCETIEHVPDPPLAVRQLARVLKPGGRLYLTTPNYMSSMGLYRAYCWARGRTWDEGGQPLCQLTMTPRTRRWVTRAGLRVILTDGVGQYLPFPGRPPIRLGFLEHPHLVMRWFGLHSLVVAQRRRPSPEAGG